MKKAIIAIAAMLFACISASAARITKNTVKVGTDIVFLPEDVLPEHRFDCFFAQSQVDRKQSQRISFMADLDGYTPKEEIIGHKLDCISVDTVSLSSHKYIVKFGFLRDDLDVVYMVVGPYVDNKLYKANTFSFSEQFIESRLVEGTKNKYITGVNVKALSRSLIDVTADDCIKKLKEYANDSTLLRQHSWSKKYLAGKEPVYILSRGENGFLETQKDSIEFSCKELFAFHSKLNSIGFSSSYRDAKELVNFLNQSVTYGIGDFKYLGLAFDKENKASVWYSVGPDYFSVTLNSISRYKKEVADKIKSGDADIDKKISEFIKEVCKGDPHAVRLLGRQISSKGKPVYIVAVSASDIEQQIKEYFADDLIYIVQPIDSYELSFIRNVNNSIAGKDVWLLQSAFFMKKSTKNNPRIDYETISYSGNHYGKPGTYVTTINESWLNEGKSELWSGIIGTNGLVHYHVHVAGIERRKPLISDGDIRERNGYDSALAYMQRRFHYEDETYYLKITPCPEQTYKLNDYSSALTLGKNLDAAIYIPFRTELIEKIKTEDEMKAFADEFHRLSQESWDSYMDKAKARYLSLSRLYGEETATIIAGGNVRFGFTTEMCMAALDGEPYQMEYYVDTPFGKATKYNFYTQDIQLYFIDNILIGIAWRGNGLKYHM